MHSHPLNRIDACAHDSGLRGVNAGLKMAVAAFALAFCVATRSLPVCALVAIAAACLTTGPGRVPPWDYLRQLAAPLAFVLVSALAMAVEFSAIPIGDWHMAIGPVHVGVFAGSLRQGLVLGATAMGAVSAMLALAFSTTAGEITAVLAWMRVPGFLVELMGMTYRFVFIMADTFMRLRTAARSRLGFSGGVRSVRTLGGLVGNLFVVTLLNADAYYNALLSRGYRGRLEFLQAERPLTARHTGAALALCGALALAWLAAR